MKKSSVAVFLVIVALICFALSGVMSYKGYDKLVNYYNSEYTTAYNVNAYVGGDAYNYIINGNYATGFFVLAMGFFLGGTVFLSFGLFIKTYSDKAGLNYDLLKSIESKMSAEIRNNSSLGGADDERNQ